MKTKNILIKKIIPNLFSESGKFDKGNVYVELDAYVELDTLKTKTLFEFNIQLLSR